MYKPIYISRVINGNRIYMSSALDIVSSVTNMLLVIGPSIPSVCNMFLLRVKPLYNAQIAKIFLSHVLCNILNQIPR